VGRALSRFDFTVNNKMYHVPVCLMLADGVKIASRANVHYVHEKFLRAFFKSQSQKTKKIFLAPEGRWCPAGANRLASDCALCA
jgi:hypothetical protein